MDDNGKQNDSRLPLRLNTVCTSTDQFRWSHLEWEKKKKNPPSGERAGLPIWKLNLFWMNVVYEK